MINWNSSQSALFDSFPRWLAVVVMIGIGSLSEARTASAQLSAADRAQAVTQNQLNRSMNIPQRSAQINSQLQSVTRNQLNRSNVLHQQIANRTPQMQYHLYHNWNDARQAQHAEVLRKSQLRPPLQFHGMETMFFGPYQAALELRLLEEQAARNANRRVRLGLDQSTEQWEPLPSVFNPRRFEGVISSGQQQQQLQQQHHFPGADLLNQSNQTLNVQQGSSAGSNERPSASPPRRTRNRR